MAEGDSSREMLELRLLGAPQIYWRGEALTLPRRQARALLYYLADADAPVSRDRLLYLFWPDEPESVARRNLIRLVSYLRKELPNPEILSVSRESLQLNPELIWIDIERFLRLRAEDATREQAIPLYRGSFLMGFSLRRSPEYDFWLTEGQRRYETLYLETLAELVRLKREQGALKTAIQYAQQYLVVDELAEEIHRDLITLHAVDGNRTAALKQYETCVQVLERELGVSPLPETHAAYTSALKGVRAPPLPPIKQTWSVLPSLHIPIVGREIAWNELEDAYQRLRSGGVILISGEAGVGKSRLMQEFATKRARTVLTGSNHPSTKPLPYHALVQALRQALPHKQLWTEIPPIWLGELSTLIPELRENFPELPPPLAVGPEQAQARLFEALTQVFLGLAVHEAPLLLCVDDLHWADETTLDWLSAISMRLADSQVCILGTFRLEERESLREIQHAYRREGLLAEVALKGLSPQAIEEILQQIPGGDSSRALLARRLHQVTGGNTFFALEMVRELLEAKQLDSPPDDLPLPNSVQETIHTRLARLTPLARQILDAAAVLSPDLELVFLYHTAGRTELEAADGLDELITRHILQEKVGVLEFRHELLRTTAYQALNPWRRKLLHRRAGVALGKVYAGGKYAVAAQMAYHNDAGEAYEQAVLSYEQAAKEAQAVYAHEEAIRHLQRAIALLPEITADSSSSSRLYEVLGINLANAGRFGMAREAYRQAIITNNPESTINLARLHWRLAKTHLTQLHYDKAEIHIEKSLDALGEHPKMPPESWWRLLLNIQMDHLYLLFCLHKVEEHDALVREISPVMEDYGTWELKRSFYRQKGSRNLLKEKFRPSEETLTIMESELAMAHESQNPEAIVSAQFSLGYGLLHAGDLKSAEGWLLEALENARLIDSRIQEARILAFLSTLYRQMGDMERTVEYTYMAGEKGAAVGSRHFVAHSLANSAWLAYHKGEIDSALENAKKAAKNFIDTKVPFVWPALVILLAIYTDSGDVDQAVAAAKIMLDPMQQRLPDDLTTALGGAVESWEKGDVEKTRDFLKQAVGLAQEMGYL